MLLRKPPATGFLRYRTRALCSSGASRLPPPSISGAVPSIEPASGPPPRRVGRINADAYELQHLNAFLGFSTQRTHPTAYNYLLGAAGGQTIIDPEETLTALRRSMQVLKQVTFRGGRTLFVSTQPTLARLTRVDGEQSGQFYLARRWVPGLLTNWEKSREHISSKLNPDPRLAAAGKVKFSDLQKAQYFRGVEQMTRPPDLIFRFDATPLYGEPASLNVPLLSVVDSDMSSREVDYPIPANTKSLRFYHTLAHMVVRACNDGATLRAALEDYSVEPEAPSGWSAGSSGQRRARNRDRDGGRSRSSRGGRGRADRNADQGRA